PSEQFELVVPPLPAETTTAPPTSAAPPTTAGAVTPPPPSVGGTATTVAGATTTTASVPIEVAANALQDLRVTWGAMLGSIQSAGSGGFQAEARVQQLADDFHVPVADLVVFTNRDTVAMDADGKAAPLTVADASTRFVFAPAPDQAAAAQICAQ